MAAAPLSRRAYAKARGVTEGAIRKAIAAGKIIVRGDGLIDPDDADRTWWRLSSAFRPLTTEANGDGEDPEFDIFADELFAYLEDGKNEHARQLAVLTEIRDGLHRVGARLDEVNLRLRILRDPFHAMTIEGQRLVQQDEARKPSPVSAGARNARRLP